jgi:hypothetical protein
MRGWVERIEEDTVNFLEYKEGGNVSTSFDDTMVSLILLVIYADPFIYSSYSAMNFMSIV